MGGLTKADEKGFWEAAESGILLLVQAPGACLKLQRLCGHVDPAVNRRHCIPSLRRGRTRGDPGVRCCGSAASVHTVLALAQEEVETQTQQQSSSAAGDVPARFFVRLPLTLSAGCDSLEQVAALVLDQPGSLSEGVEMSISAGMESSKPLFSPTWSGILVRVAPDMSEPKPADKWKLSELQAKVQEGLGESVKGALVSDVLDPGRPVSTWDADYSDARL